MLQRVFLDHSNLRIRKATASHLKQMSRRVPLSPMFSDLPKDVSVQYAAACEAVAAKIQRRATTDEMLMRRMPEQMRMKRYSFKRSQLSGNTDRPAWTRVSWRSDQELVADDLLDHFGKYGEIIDMDWLDETGEQAFEIMKLQFASAMSASAAMRDQPHNVIREADGAKVSVKIFVKFSDTMQESK